MDVVFLRCAGLDVHKKSITACRIVPDPTGQEAEGIGELREFGTMTLELLALADWLTEASITHVAIESTGEYWTPVYNLDQRAHAPAGPICSKALLPCFW
jgi:hypothetical protein